MVFRKMKTDMRFIFVFEALFIKIVKKSANDRQTNYKTFQTVLSIKCFPSISVASPILLCPYMRGRECKMSLTNFQRHASLENLSQQRNLKPSMWNDPGSLSFLRVYNQILNRIVLFWQSLASLFILR